MVGSRREFLVATFSAGAAVLSLLGQIADAATSHVKSATAITQVFGTGQRLTAVAVEYDQAIDNSKLSLKSFSVKDRTVTKVYANSAATPAPNGTNGNFVIIEVSPDDKDAPLYLQVKRDVVRKDAKATITRTGKVIAASGKTYAASSAAINTTKITNLIVDDFKQLEYVDPKTKAGLKYNLFIPKNYDKSKTYPLVLFMHDAGATSPITNTTLVQGLGAVVWASPEEQAKQQAFVLAPQYSTPVVNDKSEASPDLDYTIDLVNKLTGDYAIDKNRIYATGQSGGGMMTIAMNIKYPGLFAASFIVAGQWDPAVVAPLAKDKMWIVVSQGDLKAYPGENAMTEVYEKQGAKVSRAVWSGRSTPKEFAAAVKKMQSEGNAINYVALQKGTVVLPGQDDDGGGNHVNTWRIAYTIEGIRDWLFEQHK